MEKAMAWAPCKQTADPRTRIANNQLTVGSPVRDIPYIGDYFEGRFQGMATVADVLNHFTGRSAAQIHRELSRLFMNPTRNACKATST